MQAGALELRFSEEEDPDADAMEDVLGGAATLDRCARAAGGRAQGG